jgi:hypothetical protein
VALATIFAAINRESAGVEDEWIGRASSFVTGMVDQELLARNEYLVADAGALENPPCTDEFRLLAATRLPELTRHDAPLPYKGTPT